MDHGGGALRIRNGPHGANMMIFHRLRQHPRTAATYPSEGPVLAITSDKKDRSKLYPIPDQCFVTKVETGDSPVNVAGIARGMVQRG